MKEPGFPPPPPPKSQSPEPDKKTIEAFYSLRDEGKLPTGKDGEAIGLIEFMERAERGEGDILPVEERPGDITIEEVIEGFGKSSGEGGDLAQEPEKSSRDKARQRRSRGEAAPEAGDEAFIETPRENREALRDAVAQFENVSAQSPAEAERVAVQTAEIAYLTAYKQLEQKKTIWNRLSKGKDLEEESLKVDALKRAYDEARVTYGEALTRSAQERLSGKGADSARTDAVVERYNRIVRFNEVVKPAAERRTLARKEALDARGKGVFEKTLGWSARQNKRLEKGMGKTGATAVRAIIGAIGVSGLMAAAGGFGAAAIAGAGVYGAHKALRGFVGAYAGKLGGDMAGTFYEQRFGKMAQAQAKQSLKTEGREAGLSVEALENIDRLREKLASRADDATVQKKKALVQALVAFGIGAGAAAALSEVFAVQKAADTVVESVGNAADMPAAEAAAPGAVAEATPEAPGIETAPVPEAPLAEAIVGKGEGFNQLFVELRASGLAPDSPVAQHLLNPELSPSELSREVGALLGDKSAVTQVGDKLFVNSEGSLIFERDGVQQVLMENKGGTVSVQVLTDIELKGTASIVSEPVQATAETESSVSNDIPESASPETEVEATVGRSLAEFGTETDAVPATDPAATGTVGRSLEQFGASQNHAPQEVQGSGTVGRSLEEFVAEDADTETFTNVHGVEVNPAEPAAYVWSVPGTDTSITVASGGTPEAQSDFARAYADAHPGSTVHFVVPVFEDGVIKFRMDAWDSVEGVPAQRYTDIVSGQSGTPYPSFSPDAFTRKLP